MASKGKAEIKEFLDALPPDQRGALAGARAVILKHLPQGYVERMSGRFINYEIPLERYPKTYNGQPLMYAALAAQKNYCALYLVGAYQDPAVEKSLKAGFKADGKKLDMGKSCIRFRNLDDLPLDVIGAAVAHSPVADFIKQHEAARSAARGRTAK